MENTGQRTADERSASLEEYVTSHYEKWKAKVDYMSGLLKKLPDLVELQTTVYSVRQECLEYYYTLVNKISEHSKKYKRDYAERYNWYRRSLRYGMAPIRPSTLRYHRICLIIHTGSRCSMRSRSICRRR